MAWQSDTLELQNFVLFTPETMSRLLLKNVMRVAAVPRVAAIRTPILRVPCTMAIRSFCDKKAPLEDTKDENGREEEEDSLSAVSDLEIQNQKLVQEVKDLKDKLLRSLAEEENVRRIAKRDVENAKAYANSSFAKSLLDVADNLERALAATKDSQKSASSDDSVKILLEGVEMTQAQLSKVFTTYGISKV